jgi:hypothetical protein
MLLAHIAVAEVHICDVGIRGRPDSDIPAVIGIGGDDDGLPLPADGTPPATLAGKDVAFFRDLLERARAHTHRHAETLADADLDREIVRPRPDGGKRVLNVRWALFHLLEHQAGHHGQIQLLKHLRRGQGRD